ncbi:uncharacterized protein LOC127877602 isoform X2 [Dreissena polymorpha]|uniref:Poly [ADP-ribose] polymerase n=2 Tax=Dreissena polymorpha TaxID=45954 RepID=A0A9D4K5U5_DREPO|nr:uncharacterized protein LOC127877602 isoform X2 [Dreissena polymorpha]XP_052279593.1 uncharacterized protein LOC127877602 isoform X2 [Dreissena polymorpha]KAH3833545.1 hypothetical protein DPMN_106858 [Dreissena polymorpha]
MESKPNGNLRLFDDDEEGQPNEHEARTDITQSVAKGEAESSAISESRHIVMPTTDMRTEQSSSMSPIDKQQFVHNNSPQRHSYDLLTSQTEPESLDLGAGVHPPWRKTPYLPFKVEQPIDVAKAKMLLFKGFDQFVETTFDKKQGRINIRAKSEDELICIQISMHQCLEQVITKERHVMENTLAEFLDKGPCRKCLNDKLAEKQIEAVLDVDTQLCTLVAYAYTDVNLDKALNVYDKTFIQRDIPLQPQEVDEIEMAVERVRQKNLQLVHIAMSSKCVKLYGLDSTEVEETERQIWNIKREYKPKDLSFPACVEICIAAAGLDSTRVEEKERQIRNIKMECKPKDLSFTACVQLCNAEARCFKHHFSSDLESAIRQRNGQYLSEQSGEDDDIKITVTTTGEPGIKDLLEQTVKKMFKEQFDFSKASIDANDEHLLWTGLAGNEGRTYLKQCEVIFNCFIDLSKKREDPRDGRSRVKVVSTEDCFTSNSSDDDSSSSEEDDAVNYQVNMEKTPRQTFAELQGDIRDEETALQLAIQLSKEACIARPGNDDNDSDEATSGLYARTCSHTLNNIHVHVVKGDIVKQQADALVNIVSYNMKFGETRVSQMFLKAGGPDIEMAYNAARQNNPHRRVLVTPRFRHLRCKNVIHVGLQKGKDKCKQCISDTFTKILHECEKNKWSSIALPPLGVGHMYNYTEIDCAEQTFVSLTTHHNNNHLQEVTIVVYDDKAFRVFVKALKSVAKEMPSCRQGQHPMAAPSMGKHPKSRALSMEDTFNRKTVSEQTFATPQAFGTISHTPPNQARGANPPGRSSRMKHGKGHRRHAASSRQSGHGQHDATRPNKSRKRISHERETATKITVYAKDKATCKHALKQMGKKMKTDFLYEERIERVPSLSKEAKSEIAKAINDHKVLVRKEKEHYLLKGKQDNVLKAHGHILKIILRNHGESPVSSPPSRSQRETVEYAKFMTTADHTVPVYWKNYKPGALLNKLMLNVKHFMNGKDYEKVDLDPNSTTYKQIVRMVKKTTDKSDIGKGKDATGLGGYSKLWITNVQRVENLDVFKKYCNKRQEIFKNLVKQKRGAWPKVEETPNASGKIITSTYFSREMASDLQSEINEVLLFHGTKLDTIDTICQSGFDTRLASRDAMFGQGVYGAEKPTKADQYTDDQNARTIGQGQIKQMFLMRMLLGHCFICTDQNHPHKYRRAPCCKCKRDDCKEHFDSGNYDSVVGDNKKLFREFIVYERDQCYPEYLITYERR